MTLLFLRAGAFYENFDEALQQRDWQGAVVQEVVGPDDLSHAEAARIIGERIGMPALRYVQMPYEAWAEVLVEAGLSHSVAGVITDLARSINEGRVKAADRAGLGRPGRTRFQDYVESGFPATIGG